MPYSTYVKHRLQIYVVFDNKKTHHKFTIERDTCKGAPPSFTYNHECGHHGRGGQLTESEFKRFLQYVSRDMNGRRIYKSVSYIFPDTKSWYPVEIKNKENGTQADQEVVLKR